METKVLTQEEIQLLKTVQQKRSQLTEQFGIIELSLQELANRKEMLKEELIKLSKEEIEIGGNLQAKYGDGSINLEKGEFISN
jgi:hypothetical protein